MIEKWKHNLEKKCGIAGAISMDLPKAFDKINHELLQNLRHMASIKVHLQFY